MDTFRFDYRLIDVTIPPQSGEFTHSENTYIKGDKKRTYFFSEERSGNKCVISISFDIVFGFLYVKKIDHWTELSQVTNFPKPKTDVEHLIYSSAIANNLAGDLSVSPFLTDERLGSDKKIIDEYLKRSKVNVVSHNLNLVLTCYVSYLSYIGFEISKEEAEILVDQVSKASSLDYLEIKLFNHQHNITEMFLQWIRSNRKEIEESL